MTKSDKHDLLKLADIIETKEFWNKKTTDGYLDESLSEDKRDGSQFNLQEWFFSCGMPSCAAGHAICEFPERFGYAGRKKGKREDLDGNYFYVDHEDFAEAFNLDLKDSERITSTELYKGKNPKPQTVAKRIRQVVKDIEKKL